MFFNQEQTWQSIQASPLAPQPRERDLVAEVAEGFVAGWLGSKIIKKVAPLPRPWPGR